MGELAEITIHPEGGNGGEEAIPLFLNRQRAIHGGVAGADAIPTLDRPPDADSAAQPSPEDGIVYTRTRVTAADKEVLARNRVITAQRSDEVGDAYKILAIQVLQRLRDRGRNSLAVVSPGDGEGKTLTAVNLAISLAAEVDYTVLLVDANLRDPGVHKCFGMTPKAGLADHLLANTPVEDILVNPGIERLVILPGGRPIRNSAEMLGSLKMHRLVQDLKTRYATRLIVFDLPPILSGGDALACVPLVDAAVMVVEESVTSRDDILRAAQLLNSIELIGTVLNKSARKELPQLGSKPGWLRRVFG